MVIAHGRHLAVLLRRFDIWDLIDAGVALGAARFGELGEGAPGERLEEIRHGMPGAADE